MSKVALLGMGAMGFRMAQNLLKENHEVIVYNRTTKVASPLVSQGATLALTPKDAAKQADFVISMVTNNEASESIWLDEDTGAIHGLNVGSVAIECSTLNPDWIKKLNYAITDKGAEFLDAPVVGSRPQAEAGELIFLVGGKESTLKKSEPVLMTMASTIYHMGDISAGSIMKLVVNTLFGIQVTALGEVLGVINKMGIFSKTKALDVLSALPTTSPAMKGVGVLIANDNTSPLFPISLVEKDFNYMLEIANLIDAKAPSTKITHEIYKKAVDCGYGMENISGVSQLYN
ncbi:MAG: NAD(P)-dependent oxidoreductase [Methylococcales bacterium]